MVKWTLVFTAQAKKDAKRLASAGLNRRTAKSILAIRGWGWSVETLTGLKWSRRKRSTFTEDGQWSNRL